MNPPLRTAVVVGDALLDVDIDGEVERVCPDAPAPVVEVQARRARPGGAGLAAAIAAEAGVPVTLVCALADDDAASEVRALLAAHGVHVVALPSPSPTPVKQRVRSSGQTLVRLDSGGLAEHPTDALPPGAADAIASAAAILVADYGRGMSGLPSVRAALAAASAPIVWDPHPRGAAPVHRTTVATPNHREVLALAGDALDPTSGPLTKLTAAARQVLEQWEISALAVTRGAEGALLVRPDAAPLAIPAPQVAVADPCGAGDAFAARVATALATGQVLPAAIEAATESAAAFVDRARQPTGGGHWSSSDGGRTVPLRSVDRSPSRTAVTVAAGGCFDLLHAGHVALLEQARGLGDRLIVLLNSDASVRRLKGPDRPLQPAEDRRRVLLALACVDDVVVFDEDTPEAVLDRLRPEIFAKGGDYAGMEIPETRQVARWGGQAVFLPYLGGRSTTRLVEGARRGA